MIPISLGAATASKNLSALVSKAAQIMSNNPNAVKSSALVGAGAAGTLGVQKGFQSITNALNPINNEGGVNIVGVIFIILILVALVYFFGTKKRR
ncbi:hypothetical protein [Methanococcus maripaludis]|jgi:hypothetical protein|uniref:Uncharacterized protein n=1 Tax=Methanococcus maripaludis TaxID=39152 RepID=A0A8T3W0E0_METMI|nr:hypothetical protein [Methanococcus maripaludis]MBG0769681.1 hypothetical protein [Methanococcus maripaludis]